MSPSADRPIAMFDSGFGGLTVARALIDLAPHEDLVYFGDTGRYPYGPRPHDEVRGYAHQITDCMIEAHDPKLVVVACNTATAVALLALMMGSAVSAVELTPDNWDSETAGKTVFIKFLAPW